MPITTVPVSGKNKHIVKNDNEKFRCQQKENAKKNPKKTPTNKTNCFYMFTIN